ncbi:MAG: hypothetical protein JXE06_00295 [Coriobacteriia bacterium]|jgi:hypothetical protein|nr:hypothetical protein [Coriobacteriia bacterium]
MAEVKPVRRVKRVAPVVDRWLIDVDTEEAPEAEIDPYAGRFFGDQVDYEFEDSDFDRTGGGLFSF